MSRVEEEEARLRLPAEALLEPLEAEPQVRRRRVLVGGRVLVVDEQHDVVRVVAVVIDEQPLQRARVVAR